MGNAVIMVRQFKPKMSVTDGHDAHPISEPSFMHLNIIYEIGLLMLQFLQMNQFSYRIKTEFVSQKIWGR